MHRKKILNSVNRLKRAEGALPIQQGGAVAAMAAAPVGVAPVAAIAAAAPAAGGAVAALVGSPAGAGGGAGAGPVAPAIAGDAGAAAGQVAVSEMPPINFEELLTWVRHGKSKKVKEVLGPLQSQKFDPNTTRMQVSACMCVCATRMCV